MLIISCIPYFPIFLPYFPIFLPSPSFFLTSPILSVWIKYHSIVDAKIECHWICPGAHYPSGRVSSGNDDTPNITVLHTCSDICCCFETKYLAGAGR